MYVHIYIHIYIRDPGKRTPGLVTCSGRMGYMGDRDPFLGVPGTLETAESLVTTLRRFDGVHQRPKTSQPGVGGPHCIHRVPARLQSDVPGAKYVEKHNVF